MLRHSFLLLLLGAPFAAGAAPSADLFDNFQGEWRSRWREESFFGKPTRYEVALEDGRPVLHAISESAHAGLARRIDLANPRRAHLAWRWKVRAPLVGNTRERERAGDDYSARVIVVFETSLIPFLTRAINYVWAAHEPNEATYPSPYTRNVGTVVVRSGTTDAGKWCDETRDVLADYRRHFGEAATRITAVAVLVDTDNTGRQAEAWFADLMLDTTPRTNLLP